MNDCCRAAVDKERERWLREEACAYCADMARRANPSPEPSSGETRMVYEMWSKSFGGVLYGVAAESSSVKEQKCSRCHHWSHDFVCREKDHNNLKCGCPASNTR